nr:unnamed protein product [Digitaria exilis]
MAARRIIGSVHVTIILVILAFLAVSGVARQLGGTDLRAPAGESSVVSGEGVMQFLRQMYLQWLRAGPGTSCGTNSSNGGCPHGMNGGI